MLLNRLVCFVLIASFPALSLTGQLRAQDPQDVFLEEISSVPTGDSLVAFEIETTPITVDEATRLLENAIAIVLSVESISERDIRDLRETIEADAETVEGNLRSVPTVEFELDLRARRLDVTSDDPSPAPGESGGIRSQQNAVELALAIIERLHDKGIIDRAQFDLAEPQLGQQKTGSGQVGKPYERANETVVDYRVTFKRVINKIPVVGSYVRVVLDRGGGVTQLNLSLRQLRGERRDGAWWPTGTGILVPIDRSPEEAKKELREKSGLAASSRLHVERWGVAYIDTGMPDQEYLQPVYVFLATTLTETERGTIAGRKGVRIVPASSVTLEPLSFDPLRPDGPERVRPRGDARR